MKRLSLLLILAVMMPLLMLGSCGKKPPPVEEPLPVDTTPTEEPTPPPPPEEPPPPPPQLQESQLKTIYFDFDKYNLRADARADLDHNYSMLTEFPDVIVQIEGHCDERGTVEYNLSLGDKRANAARDYLVGLGIAEGRITTISYGEERPVDRRSNEEAWAKNRRCEFRIVSQ
jgi:peptidoglycan-associated lipoprotein